MNRELSDVDKDGKLNEAQFIVAMYLINSKLRGSEVPDSLPDFLKSELGISTTSADDKKTMKLRVNYNIDLSDIVTPTPVSTPAPSLTPNPNPNPIPASTGTPVVTPGVVTTPVSLVGIQPTLSTTILVPNTGITPSLPVPNSAFISTTDFSTPPAPLPLPVNSSTSLLTPSTLSPTTPAPSLTPTPVITNTSPNVVPATIGFSAVSPNPVKVEITSNITSLHQKKDDLTLQLTDEKNNNQMLENEYVQLSAEQDSLTKQ